jgi:hypothetical protein
MARHNAHAVRGKLVQVALLAVVFPQSRQCHLMTTPRQRTDELIGAHADRIGCIGDDAENVHAYVVVVYQSPSMSVSTTRAGAPMTFVRSGTSCVTSAPAATAA